MQDTLVVSNNCLVLGMGDSSMLGTRTQKESGLRWLQVKDNLQVIYIFGSLSCRPILSPSPVSLASPLLMLLQGSYLRFSFQETRMLAVTINPTSTCFSLVVLELQKACDRGRIVALIRCLISLKGFYDQEDRYRRRFTLFPISINANEYSRVAKMDHGWWIPDFFLPKMYPHPSAGFVSFHQNQVKWYSFFLRSGLICSCILLIPPSSNSKSAGISSQNLNAPSPMPSLNPPTPS